jgi:hypothetical protein
VGEAPWNDDMDEPDITERELREGIGEGEPGGAEHATAEDAADQSDSVDERL